MELTSPEKLLTKGELLAILQISRTTLYRYEQKGLPSVQILGRKRYQLEAVENWLEAKKNEPYPEGKIDDDALQELWSVSRTTLHRLRKEGLPYEKKAGRILYDVNDIEAWLQKKHKNQD